jgi:hypothetical protein
MRELYPETPRSLDGIVGPIKQWSESPVPLHPELEITTVVSEKIPVFEAFEETHADILASLPPLFPEPPRETDPTQRIAQELRELSTSIHNAEELQTILDALILLQRARKQWELGEQLREKIRNEATSGSVDFVRAKQLSRALAAALESLGEPI